MKKQTSIHIRPFPLTRKRLGNDGVHLIAISGLFASNGKQGGFMGEYSGYESSREANLLDEIGAELLGDYFIKGIIPRGENRVPVFEYRSYESKRNEGWEVEVYKLDSGQLLELDEHELMYGTIRRKVYATPLSQSGPMIEVWAYFI